jgi:hypothetical protein
MLQGGGGVEIGEERLEAGSEWKSKSDCGHGLVSAVLLQGLSVHENEMLGGW